MGGSDTFGRREGEGRAPTWIEADGLHTGKFCHHIGPGTGGIDHYGSLVADPAGLHVPQVSGSFERGYFGVANDCTASAPHPAQVTLMQGIHININRVWV